MLDVRVSGHCYLDYLHVHHAREGAEPFRDVLRVMPNVMESAFSHPGYQHLPRGQEGAGQHQHALPAMPSPKESNRDRSHLGYLHFRCAREGAKQPRNVLLARPSATVLGSSPPGRPYQRHVQGRAEQL
jgi:hypothetical protein